MPPYNGARMGFRGHVNWEGRGGGITRVELPPLLDQQSSQTQLADKLANTTPRHCIDAPTKASIDQFSKVASSRV